MKVFETILLILGAAFIGVGGMVGGIFALVFQDTDEKGFLLIPLFFVILGLCFIAGVIVSRAKKKAIITKGKKYSGKIYGYISNTSVVVNGEFTMDTKVRYFDENGIEREAIIPTGFSKGAGSGYPIGMTIDIYELNGKYNFDPKSVRSEVLFREQELMDDKPIDPGKLNIKAVDCPNCGASFEAADGYSNKCPYCGSFINA